VVFVNLEDTFREIEQQLSERPVYLCILYDADLLAMENLTELLFDISIGVFRVPKDNLKIMRRIHADSSMPAYPFSLTDQGWSYPENESKEMTDFMKERLFLPY
jgi:hypothetical protein